MLPAWLHVLLCLLVPAVWGVVVHRVIRRIGAKRPTNEGELPPIDYSI